MFPSLAEPIGTTQQYIEFAKLSEKSVAIDLGAYSGLASMLFDMEISKNNKNAEGKVVAVDADLKNVECIKYNLSEYKKCTGKHIEYINAAVSSFDGTVGFCCDGCLGAAIIKFVGARGSVSKIPCVKLSTIAKKYNLKRVDFIKCDIEGAEVDVFNDREFFEKYSPRMIVECHRLSNGLTTDTVVKCLKKVGYSCKEVEQIGFDLPLLECVPTFAKKTLHFLKKYLCFNS